MVVCAGVGSFCHRRWVAIFRDSRAWRVVCASARKTKKTALGGNTIERFSQERTLVWTRARDSHFVRAGEIDSAGAGGSGGAAGAPGARSSAIDVLWNAA